MQGGARASAATVGLVFLGLAVLTALLAGSFWVVATGSSGGDPSQLALAGSRCTVSSDADGSGVGTATFSMRYDGNHTVDLSAATVQYSDETTTATLDLAERASRSTARVFNESDAFDARIERGETLTVVVPVERVRGTPLRSGERASVALLVDGGTVATANVRPPNAMSASQSYVGC